MFGTGGGHVEGRNAVVSSCTSWCPVNINTRQWERSRCCSFESLYVMPDCMDRHYSGVLRSHCFLTRTCVFPAEILPVYEYYMNYKWCGWTYLSLKDLRFSQRWLWIIASSGMLRRVTLVRTDVSEELSAFIIRVTRIDELGTTLAVTSNRHTTSVTSSPILVTLIMEALNSSDTSVLTRVTRRNIQEDAVLHFSLIFRFHWCLRNYYWTCSY
jgi:hypothetical protein